MDQLKDNLSSSNKIILPKEYQIKMMFKEAIETLLKAKEMFEKANIEICSLTW